MGCSDDSDAMIQILAGYFELNKMGDLTLYKEKKINVELYVLFDGFVFYGRFVFLIWKEFKLLDSVVTQGKVSTSE